MSERPASPTHVLLLRAVNVGGRNRVPKADLAELAAEAGLADVAVHLNSGNVLGTPDAGDHVDDVAARLRALLAERLGVDTSVHAAARTELSALVDGLLASDLLAPGETLDSVDPKAVHLVLLDTVPHPEAGEALAAVDAGDDRAVVVGRGVWVRYAGPSHSSRLGLPRIERAASGDAPPAQRRVGTARNLATVRVLAGR